MAHHCTCFHAQEIQFARDAPKAPPEFVLINYRRLETSEWAAAS